MIEQCTTDLTTLRGNVDEFSQQIFQHSCRVAKKSEIAVVIPRVSQQQRHRFNSECDSADQYYGYTTVIPLLDHLINDLSSRFHAHAKQVASL